MASEDATQQARDLKGEIAQHARAHDNKSLLTIALDPETERTLAVLPQRELRQAEVHLESARIWQVTQNEKAKRKLDAASKAIDGLDISLARGVLRKIDAGVIDEPELVRYDELVLAVESRAVELEEIEGRLPPTPPKDTRSRQKRFWRR
jgi:hypothetical protein